MALFLLTGQPSGLIPDDNIRVSVKSLTLICIGHIFKIDASLFFEPLFKGSDCQQMIEDVLLYADHPDPQIRANLSTVVGFLLKSIFVQYDNSFLHLDAKSFRDENEKLNFLDRLINILIKVVF